MLHVIKFCPKTHMAVTEYVAFRIKGMHITLLISLTPYPRIRGRARTNVGKVSIFEISFLCPGLETQHCFQDSLLLPERLTRAVQVPRGPGSWWGAGGVRTPNLGENGSPQTRGAHLSCTQVMTMTRRQSMHSADSSSGSISQAARMPRGAARLASGLPTRWATASRSFCGTQTRVAEHSTRLSRHDIPLVTYTTRTQKREAASTKRTTKFLHYHSPHYSNNEMA